MLPGVIGYDEKNKSLTLTSDFPDDEKIFFFHSRTHSFQLPILFSWEPQGRSDNNTMEKELIAAFILTENSKIKRIFLKAKRVVLFPSY